MPWNTTLFDSTGKIKDARLILGAYYALGVPHPSESFGYDPLTKTHTVPANWPTAESVGDYFIDKSHASATDTANTYGYPDKPRLTPVLAVTLGAGNVYAFGNTSGTDDYTPIGGQSFIAITANGTQADPCFVVGDYDGTRAIVNTADGDAGVAASANSTHCIFEGFEGFNCRQIAGTDTPVSYITFRDFFVSGNNAVTGAAGTCMFVSSAAGNTIDHVVFYNNTIQNLNGPFRDGDATDFNAFIAAWNCEDIWFIGNTSSGMDGDSIRIGDNITQAGGRTKLTRCYVAKNDFSGNSENPMDVKSCTLAVISENDFYDALASNSDPGMLIPMHESAENIYVLGNKLHDAVGGINLTTAGGGVGNVYSMFNEYYNIYREYDPAIIGNPSFDPGWGKDVGMCINARDTGHSVWSINDTYQNYDIGFKQPNLSIDSNVVGCIFASRRAVETFTYDVAMEGSENVGEEIDHNCYGDMSVNLGANGVQTTIAGMQAQSHEDSGVEGAINFTNEAADDFTLGATSTALGVGINAAAQAIYDQFFTDFGFELFDTTDYPDKGGNARPAAIADWDAGAHERA